MDAWFAEWVRRHHQDVDALVDDSELPLAERLIQSTQRAAANRIELATQLVTETCTHAAKLGLSEVEIPQDFLKGLGLDHLDHWPYIDDDAMTLYYRGPANLLWSVGFVWGKDKVEAKRKEVANEKKQREETLKRDQAQREFEDKWIGRACKALVSIVVVAISVMVAYGVRR